MKQAAAVITIKKRIEARGIPEDRNAHSGY
jgi:hypothetical protein